MDGEVLGGNLGGAMRIGNFKKGKVMNEKSIPAIARPKTDDRPMWDILSGIFGYSAVLVSHDLKLFALLAEKPRTLPEVCEALGIASRPAAALLSVNASLELVRLKDGRYALTPFSEDYLVENSPTSFSGYLDLVTATYSVYSSVESLKKAVLTNSSQVYGGEEQENTGEGFKMVTEVDLPVEERLFQLFRHLEIERAHTRS